MISWKISQFFSPCVSFGIISLANTRIFCQKFQHFIKTTNFSFMSAIRAFRWPSKNQFYSPPTKNFSGYAFENYIIFFLLILYLNDSINFAILFIFFHHFDIKTPFFSDGTMEEFSPAGDGKWNTIDTVKSAFKFVQAIAF